MDVWQQKCIFHSSPFFPKKGSHLPFSCFFFKKKKEKSLLTLVQQKCDTVHPCLDRSALFFLFSFFFFLFCFWPYWWGVDGLHGYQIGTLTSEHPRWEMHWRWAFLSETAFFFFFFFITSSSFTHSFSLYLRHVSVVLTLHLVVLTLL